MILGCVTDYELKLEEEALASDAFLRGPRWLPMIFGASINIFTSASLAQCDIPVH